jgi:GNAT superfamily N-acetyltransferase
VQPDAVTEATFARLVDGDDPALVGLVAERDGRLAGLAHLVFHPSTWSTAGYCYLEDLFVAREARGGGVGEALFAAVYAEADHAGAERVYWHTQEYNAPARSLYDQVGHRT